MDPITPGTWPQVFSVAVFLALLALPTLAIHPTLRKDGHKLAAYAMVTAALVIPTALTALNMSTFVPLAVGGVLLYAAFLVWGVAASVRARWRHHKAKAKAEANAEILARFEADINRNGPTL